MKFEPLIPNLRSDLTSEAVWRPQGPLNLILCWYLIDGSSLLTMYQFLKKSSKVSPKILLNHPKIKFSIFIMSAATLLGLNLVFF